jgi:hypothetical protein
MIIAIKRDNLPQQHTRLIIATEKENVSCEGAAYTWHVGRASGLNMLKIRITFVANDQSTQLTENNSYNRILNSK